MTADTPPDKLEGRAELAAAMFEAATLARLEVLILSFEFDRTLYGGEDFVDEIKRVVLSTERAKVRVLINQPRAAMKASHRLVELGRRVPSRIEFRELSDERQITQRGEWLIIDQRQFIERRAPDSLVAYGWRDAALQARAKAREFNELWEESQPSTEFRVLGI
ncbi:MAG TPA: hypothetical protein VFK72_06745 [Nevskia sp.]|nr:hypothetical protein [Nevskia sp.]